MKTKNYNVGCVLDYLINGNHNYTLDAYGINVRDNRLNVSKKMICLNGKWDIDWSLNPECKIEDIKGLTRLLGDDFSKFEEYIR